MKLIDSLDHQPQALSFGTSGLRDLVSDMTDLECYINTRGFLDFLCLHDGLQSDETIYIAGDLRDSTPRITLAVAAAIRDDGYGLVYCGLIPTPALAYYGLTKKSACIMITGSHIPADRNGIKFHKRGGEVLKTDEADIHVSVAKVRQEVYEQPADQSAFALNGMFKQSPLPLPPIETAATDVYMDRYTSVFPADSLAGTEIVVYQHSAVGRDLLVTMMERLGAKAVPVGRSDVFVPIDTENVTELEKTRFKKFSQEHPEAFAIISADGDSDRPFVIDATGEFHRGDVLGVITADFLGARTAVLPISGNDAVDQFCQERGIDLIHTKIGSPYVIAAMQTAPADKRPSVSWEVNGGFLTDDDITLKGHTLAPLPTRDAMLPILCSLLTARRRDCSVAELFASLPRRFTGGGLIDNVPAAQIQKFREALTDPETIRKIAEQVFHGTDLGKIQKIDLTDNLRVIFDSGSIMHMRFSGNAPQFRIYTNADSQKRADELTAAAIAPDGYLVQTLRTVESLSDQTVNG